MTVYMMGDSLMKKTDITCYPQFGFGQGLELFLKPGISMENHAENGRSTKSFLEEGRFGKILEVLKEGDYVICSFGNNDEKEYDPKRYTEPYGEYQENLEYFAEEVLRKKARIVFATSPARHSFQDGKCVNTHGEYPKAMTELCRRKNYPCVDLNSLSMELYDCLGEKESERFHLVFPEKRMIFHREAKDDHSHLTMDGAVMLAYLFVKDCIRQNLSVTECFTDISELEL